MKGIRKLADAEHVQRFLFDEQDLVEIEDAENFPGEHPIVCDNPSLDDERVNHGLSFGAHSNPGHP